MPSLHAYFLGKHLHALIKEKSDAVGVIAATAEIYLVTKVDVYATLIITAYIYIMFEKEKGFPF